MKIMDEFFKEVLRGVGFILLASGMVFLSMGSMDRNSIDSVEVESCSCDRERDSLALVALYEATNGGNWTNPWDLATPISSWYRVSTDSEGCVTQLQLFRNNLNGQLPSQLGDLSRLLTLHLNDNGITGSIPSQFWRMNQIVTLDLGGTSLEDTIPKTIEQMTSLLALQLDGMNLSGKIPKEIGNLENLFRLHLDYNELSGEIPSELGDLENLQEMQLGNNKLSGEIPSELGQLSRLNFLNLEANNLSGTIPRALGDLERILSINLEKNNLSGSIPAELAQLSELSSIRVNDNNLDSCFHSDLINLCSLGIKDFEGNKALPWQGDFSRFCTGESQIGAPCDDGNPNTQNDIITTDCGCIGTVVNVCRQNDSLVLVNLYNSTNGINWTIPWNLSQPMSTWEGIILNADGCVISIVLNDNNLIGTLPSELGNLTELESLFLENNRISGSLHSEYGNLTNLKFFVAHNNQISGSIPSELGDLTNLEDLLLSSNQLSGSIPNELGDLTNLINLTLDNNNLTGEIPAELGNLSNLFELDLSDNQLSGSIPNELGRLQNLEILELYLNRLTGEIPAELADMSRVRVLYLHQNQLSGCYPEELLNLCDLGYQTEPNFSRGYDFTRNPDLLWAGDFARYCDGDRIGASCDDGNPLTTNDQINENCDCVGEDVTQTCRYRDSLTLVDLYNATGGRNWDNMTPWDLSQPMTTWERILLNNDGCVVAIDLSNCGLSGSLPESIGSLSELVSLYLQSNTINGSIPTSIGNLVALRELHLGDNALSGAMPAEIGQLINLRLLFLYDNDLLFGNINPAIGDLVNLQALALANCAFIGTLPPSFANLTKLQELWLDNNELEGDLPDYIGTFSELYYLGLNNNNFSGEIPSSLANLTNLRRLEMAFNRFTGELPIELGNLANLDTIYLNNNRRLMGCFPESYTNFCGETYSFTGNPNLPWQGDFSRFCANESQIGAACDDSDSTTENDQITADCGCQGCIATTTNLTENICAGDTYTVGDQTFSETGDYTINLQSMAGCDSIVQLQLAVAGNARSVTRVNICEGESYEFNGSTFSTSVYYVVSLDTEAGCDSMAVLDLDVTPQTEVNESAQICAGETYPFQGRELAVSGTYRDTLRNGNSCDSIITILALTVTEDLTVQIDTLLCAGEVYEFAGQTLSESGTYLDERNSAAGCDSTTTLNLEISPILESITNATICAGESYDFNGESYTESGLYTVDLLSVTTGCDSTARLDLRVVPLVENQLNEQICTGESYDFNGQILTENGTYSDTLRSVNQCDSVITNLQLTIVETLNTAIDTALCAGNSIIIGDQDYTESGIYSQTLTSQAGCDSVVSLTLEILPTAMMNLIDTICPGESYSLGNETYSETGFYEQVFTNINGCDSTVQLQLAVIDPVTFGVAEAGADVILCSEYQHRLQSNLPLNTVGEWSSSTGIIFDNPNSPTAIAQDLQPGENRLTWTLSTNDCPNYATDEIIISVEEDLPILQADNFELSFENGDLTANVTTNDNWQFADWEVTILSTPQIGTVEMTADGTFTYELVGIGEADRFSYQLASVHCPELRDTAVVELQIIDLPKGGNDGFTPNDDGINDTFEIPELRVDPEKYPDNELVVFNRWGNIVYQAKPYNNQWKGTLRDTNQNLPAGTYYYTIRLDISDGEIRYGQVTIVR